MKWKAIIVLLTILLGIVAPPFSPMILAHDGQPAIGTLDVCHSGTPAVFSGGNMPYVNECPCHPLPPALYASINPANPLFKPTVVTFQDERPPNH